MKENDMQFVVDVIDAVLMNADDENKLKNVKAQVNEFMKQFPLYPEM
jgi:glycine hydroxymethyltransferase